jgi:hypothetical protein
MKVGDRIELIAMPDDLNPIPAGTRGTIEHINTVEFSKTDKFTQVHAQWDNGRTLMLSIPPDKVRVIR